MRTPKLTALPMMLALCCWTSTGCVEDETGQGTLTVTVWGEAFIEQGIPSTAFADGFGVTFDKFLVAISGVSVAQQGSPPAVSDPAASIWDLTQAGPFVIALSEVEAGTYDHTAYTIAPASPGILPGNATVEDVQVMTDNGYSIYVTGSAANGAVTKSFSWGFNTATVYDPCHSLGVLEDGGAVEVQLTIHGDHLFYDDATIEEPQLRFNDIALADADGDGVVTPQELLSYDITVLPNYSVPDDAIDTLWEYLAHMTTTLGHIDGEGHCD